MNQNLITQLNSTVQQAKKSVFYKKKLEDFYSIGSLDDFRKLPTTTSSDLYSQSSKFLSTSLSEVDKIVTLFTSGTTGDNKRIFFRKDELESTAYFFEKGLTPIVHKKDTVLIMMPSNGPNTIGDLIAKAVAKIGGFSIVHGMLRNFDYIIPLFPKIDSIIGTPIQILALARYCRYIQLDSPIFRGILLSADYGSEAVYEEISRIFKCPVINHYGSTEMGFGGAVECLNKNGLHTRRDDLFFEILNMFSDQKTEIGEYGEIVFTTLTRKAHPFVRYRTGDYGRLMRNPCSCGIWGEDSACLDIPKGRIDELFSPYSTPNFYQLDDLIFSHPSVLDYCASHHENYIDIHIYYLPDKTMCSNYFEEKNISEYPLKINIHQITNWPNLHLGKRTWTSSETCEL